MMKVMKQKIKKTIKIILTKLNFFARSRLVIGVMLVEVSVVDSLVDVTSEVNRFVISSSTLVISSGFCDSYFLISGFCEFSLLKSSI